MPRVPYTFKQFEQVPTQFMSDSQLADAIKMDAIIPVAQSIQKKYDMDRVVGSVTRVNQEAIDLINSSGSKNDLYPQANDFDGDDDDSLGRLHEDMDEAGDEAHDRDYEGMEDFANNTPENRWRDLRALADRVFDSGEMEEIVARKKKNEAVNHDLQKIQKRLDSVGYIDVQVARSSPGDSEEEDSVDDVIGGGDSDDDVGAGEPTPQRLTLLVALAVVLFMVSRRI